MVSTVGVGSFAIRKPARSAAACLRDRIDEILHRCIKRLLRDRQRLEQPVGPRELLHPGSPRLPLASQVAQHPLANSLRLIDHVAASLAPVLGDLLGVTLCRSKGLLSGGDGLRPGRVGGSERLGPDCLGFSFGPFGAFGGGSVRRLEHLGRLGAERFRNPMSLQRLREHGFDLGDPGCQHIAGTKFSMTAAARCSVRCTGSGSNPRSNQLERGLVELAGIEGCTIGHGHDRRSASRERCGIPQRKRVSSR